MEKSDPTLELKKMIVAKQIQYEIEGNLHKENIRSASSSFTPLNIIKSTIKDLVSSPDLKNNLVNTAVGLTTGFVAKKVLVGNTNNPVTKLFGVIVEMIVARKVTNNADEIKCMAGFIFNKLIDKKAQE